MLSSAPARRRPPLAAPDPPDPARSRATCGSRSAAACRAWARSPSRTPSTSCPAATRRSRTSSGCGGRSSPGGGDASVCEARFVEGLSRRSGGGALQRGARGRLRGARARRRGALRRPSARARQAPRAAGSRSPRRSLRLRKRLGEVAAIDFFGAPGRDAVGGHCSPPSKPRLRPPTDASRATEPPRRRDVRGRTWVTRSGRPRRPHRQRLADPPLHRSGGALQVRPRPGLPAGSRASCASTCSRPSSPTRATSARSRCCCARFGLEDPALRADRRDRPRHRPQGREVRPPGDARASTA